MRLRFVFWLCVMVACGGKPSVSGPAGASLGVAPPKTAAPKDGPLSITYFAPTGETHGGQLEISVSFDRPMVELGRHDAPAIEITPDVAGRTRWVGSQTLLFEPSAPLPMGTEFRARVAGLTALDGRALAEPLVFSFATPALALVSHSEHQDPSQHRKTPFELWFNAPVAASAIADAASLEIAGAERRSVAFAVEADEKDARHVRVTPKQAYPLASRVELTLRAGLAGREGPRPLAHDEVLRLSVYGPHQHQRRRYAAVGARAGGCPAREPRGRPAAWQYGVGTRHAVRE